MIGVRRQGGSRRGAALALVGSVVGAVTGAAIGVPIPVVGSLVAAVLFAGVGAFVGAMLGESWKGRPTGDQMKIGVAAFWGRMLGTVTKLALGAVMIAVSIIALVVA